MAMIRLTALAKVSKKTYSKTQQWLMIATNSKV